MFKIATSLLVMCGCIVT